ncbi:MAG: FHA domain-containing protein [Caldilineaceae bacterium]
MTTFDQLEIISAGGLIEFFDLHPARGLTNIGSHPENDVVLPGANVAPFHLVIDHRMAPAQLLVLSTDHPTRLDNSPVGMDRPWPLQNWSTIEVDGYTLILMQNGNGAQAATAPLTAGAAPSVTPTVTPSVAAAPLPRTTSPGAGALVPAALVAGAAAAPAPTAPAVEWTDAQQQHRLLSPVRDHVDERILAELSARELVTDVENMIAFQITVTNAGDLVSSLISPSRESIPSCARSCPPVSISETPIPASSPSP